MATTTPNYALNKPTVGGDSNTWGDLLNPNFDTIDTQMKANADLAAGADGKADTNAGAITALDGRVTQNETDITSLGNDKVSKAGDTMTGELNINTGGALSLGITAPADDGPVAIRFRDSDGVTTDAYMESRPHDTPPNVRFGVPSFAAALEPTGTTMTSTKAIVTREKGDARYELKGQAVNRAIIDMGALKEGNSMDQAAHGLGASPSVITGYIECTSSDGGYVSGKRLPAPPWMGVGDSATPINIQMSADGSNVYAQWPNTGGTRVANRSSGAMYRVDPSKWKLVIVVQE